MIVGDDRGSEIHSEKGATGDWVSAKPAKVETVKTRRKALNVTTLPGVKKSRSTPRGVEPQPSRVCARVRASEIHREAEQKKNPERVALLPEYGG